MFIDFTTFTKYFFYLFVCYHYAKYRYPEKTQDFIIFVAYNSIYFYSKLQIIVNKSMVNGHNYLIIYEKYQQLISFLQKMQDEIDIVKEHVLLQTSFAKFNFNLNADTMSNKKDITLDFVLDKIIEFSFKKTEFLTDYLNDFFPIDNTNDDETNQSDTKQNNIFNYDFIIINGEENLKKIIKSLNPHKNELKTQPENSCIFKLEPLLYKPLLCEFINGDDKVIKIDFVDNNKGYDFLVADNCFDKTFLTYFMEKYYQIDVKDSYILKILDNNVETILFESSDIVKIENTCISKVSK